MLSGFFYDPKHGGCLRHVLYDAQRNVGTIRGAYGDDEPPHRPGTPWTATFVVVDASCLVVHFGGKDVTHAKTYEAFWCPAQRVLRWEDGNTWFHAYGRGTWRTRSPT